MPTLCVYIQDGQVNVLINPRAYTNTHCRHVLTYACIINVFAHQVLFGGSYMMYKTNSPTPYSKHGML